MFHFPVDGAIVEIFVFSYLHYWYFGDLFGSNFSSGMENARYSPRSWVSILCLGYLGLRAQPPMVDVAGDGAPGLCVPSAAFLQPEATNQASVSEML